MTDEPDELELLRRVNPVADVDAPDDGLAALAARIERTIMENEKHEEHEPSHQRRRLAIAAATVVAVLGIATGAALIGNDGDQGENQVAASPSTETTAVDSEPISPGGGISPGGAASCVEQYDLTTISNREMALDATVESVDGDSVALTVNEWFRGGDEAAITLRGASTLGGITSAGEPVSLEPGTRLLVAGDGGFAWSCGFTQPYDSAVADDWREALSS
jgi:hypothetical protein